jgi:hypothetical protein
VERDPDDEVTLTRNRNQFVLKIQGTEMCMASCRVTSVKDDDAFRLMRNARPCAAMDIGLWRCVSVSISRRDNNMPIHIERFDNHLLARWPKWCLSIRQLHSAHCVVRGWTCLRCNSETQFGLDSNSHSTAGDEHRRWAHIGIRYAKLSVPICRYQILCRSR